MFWDQQVLGEGPMVVASSLRPVLPPPESETATAGLEPVTMLLNTAALSALPCHPGS